MPSNTSLTPLPYPNPTDAPFVHLDIKALAEATTESLYVVSTSAPAHKPGRRWYNPTTKTEAYSDGTSWDYVSGGVPITPPVAGSGWTVTPVSAPAYQGTSLRLLGTGIGARVILDQFGVENTSSASAGANGQTAMGSIPAGTRPAKRVSLPAVVQVAGSFIGMGHVIINADGTVVVQTNQPYTSAPAGAVTYTTARSEWIVAS